MKTLPKPHISWSSLTLWEQSKKTWWKRYVLGQKTFETKYLKTGKEFSGAVETGETDNIVIDMMLPFVQILEVMEMKVEALFPNEYFPEISLLGFKDTATGFEQFREYKTGTLPWDQNKVNQHGQLVFYALIDKYNGAEKPAKCYVDWFEVSLDPSTKKVEFTGRYETFERKITGRDLSNMEKRINKVLAEMAEYEYVETLELEDDIWWTRLSEEKPASITAG